MDKSCFGLRLRSALGGWLTCVLPHMPVIVAFIHHYNMKDAKMFNSIELGSLNKYKYTFYSNTCECPCDFFCNSSCEVSATSVWRLCSRWAISQVINIKTSTCGQILMHFQHYNQNVEFIASYCHPFTCLAWELSGTGHEWAKCISFLSFVCLNWF